MATLHQVFNKCASNAFDQALQYFNYFILSHGNYFWMKSVRPSLQNTLLHTVQHTDRLMWSCGRTTVGPGPSTLKLRPIQSEGLLMDNPLSIFSTACSHRVRVGHVPPTLLTLFNSFLTFHNMFFSPKLPLKRTKINTLSCYGQSALSRLWGYNEQQSSQRQAKKKENWHCFFENCKDVVLLSPVDNVI